MKGYGLRTGNPFDKRIYEIWRKMHFRCENEKHPSFNRYVGMGTQGSKNLMKFMSTLFVAVDMRWTKPLFYLSKSLEKPMK